MGAELLVRQAVPDDLDAAVQVITEVSAWLAGKDISWLIDFPGPFKKRIAQGEVYLAYLNDWKTLTGTVSLSREPDPELWSSYPGQARYVHRLAVRRKFAGQGIGRALLNLAGHIAAMENVPWLRLDCSKDNQALQGYYLDQGFEYLDTVDLPHRLSGALFERHSRLAPPINKRPDGRFTVPLLGDGEKTADPRLPDQRPQQLDELHSDTQIPRYPDTLDRSSGQAKPLLFVRLEEWDGY